MVERFEVAQSSRSSLPKNCDFCPHHGWLVELRSSQTTESGCTESDPAKFIRLSSESFPDLEGPLLEVLTKLCAHRSLEFFVSISKKQWVRSSITFDTGVEKPWKKPWKKLWKKLGKKTWALPSDHKPISVDSNVLPYDPYWTTLRALRCGASKRVHFPSSILLHIEQKTLMKLLFEWRELREECDIGQHEILETSVEYGGDLEKLVWKIQPSDVVPVMIINRGGADGVIWLVKWRGGSFIRKDRKGELDPHAADNELQVLKKLSHPHIVYGFGVEYWEENMGCLSERLEFFQEFVPSRPSLFMEQMECNLYNLVVENGRRRFSRRWDALDVLLQIAKAMAYMHSNGFAHGDLKSQNILVSDIEVSGDVRHFLVKLADFGDAKPTLSDKQTFLPNGSGTTGYAAPELLERRFNSELSCTRKIDLYSFGCVAYEVLTGHAVLECQREWKKVIPGKLKPSDSEAWRKLISEADVYHLELIELVESCWKLKPQDRPSFSHICDKLEECKLKLLNLYRIVVKDGQHGAAQVQSWPFSRGDSMDVLLQIAKTMEHKHSTGTVHGDLKSHNVIMGDIEISGSVRYFLDKIAHSGDAQTILEHDDDQYDAPELLKLRENQASRTSSLPKEIDVYSFGSIAHEVLTGHALDRDEMKPSGSVAWEALINEHRYPFEVIKLVESCWESEPEKRPSFFQICEELEECKLKLEITSGVLWKVVATCVCIFLIIGARFVLVSRLSSPAIFVTLFLGAAMFLRKV